MPNNNINKAVALIQHESKIAKRAIDRYQPMYDGLKAKQKQNILSCWGYRDIGYLQAFIDKNKDIIDILDDILKLIEEDNV